MLFHLVKKECLLVKKYLLVMFLVAVAFPPFMTSKMGLNAGFMIFLTTAFVIQLLLTGTVSLAETKYEKGAALLCAIPYTRSLLVKAKYVFDILIFASFCIIYTVIAFAFPKYLTLMDWFSIGIVFLLLTIIRGIILPLEYKLGYEKTKYISMIFIMATPFLLPSLIKSLQANTINFDILATIPPVIESIIPFLLAFVVGIISMIISHKVYSKKEL